MWGSQDRLVLDALSRSLALIEFDPQGTVLAANDRFCAVLGYTRAEVVGHHHRMFVEPDEARSEAYAAFWERLRQGEAIAAEFARIAKGGREIWIQGSYNPVLNAAGKVTKIVKHATDITLRKAADLEIAAKLEALSRAQAVIEFKPDGTIIRANQNFLDVNRARWGSGEPRRYRGALSHPALSGGERTCRVSSRVLLPLLA